MKPPSALLTRWLDAVNQPVVDDVEYRIERALNIISDGGGFTLAECREILRELIESRS